MLHDECNTFAGISEKVNLQQPNRSDFLVQNILYDNKNSEPNAEKEVSED